MKQTLFNIVYLNITFRKSEYKNVQKRNNLAIYER